MDAFDRDRYARVYRLLAEVLGRERPPQEHEGLSYTLGDVFRRVFLATRFDPPGDLLEEVGRVIQTGTPAQLQQIAHRLQEHAEHLEHWEEIPPEGA